MAPPGSRSSCTPAQPPAIDSGTAGALERIALMPPAGGWCDGTYLVTVFLQRGPYCPKPAEGQPPTACPEFATQELETGSTSFLVGSGAPEVSVPHLKGLRPAAADRRLRRRHLKVRYTALGNLCAGIPPHGRIILQKPAAGVRVPRGSTVLSRPAAEPDRDSGGSRRHRRVSAMRSRTCLLPPASATFAPPAVASGPRCTGRKARYR